MLVASALPAQTNDEINAGLQFSFAPPGARSRGMGGAFIGLADDATAAYSNPAGLLWLRKPEVAVEARASRFSLRYPDRGSASGSPSLCDGAGGEVCLDTLRGVALDETERSVSNLPFVSYVHLFRKRGARGADGRGAFYEKWRAALFRHELAAFEAGIESQGLFLGGEGTRRSRRTRLAAVRGELDLAIRGFGVALARELVRGSTWRLWGGASVALYDFRLAATTRRYRNIDVQAGGGNPALTGPADFSDGNEIDRHLQQGSDSGVGVNLGLLLRGERERWTVGAVYRKAPAFEFDYVFQWRQGAFEEAEELANPDRVDPGLEQALSGTARFEVPDVWGLGASFRPVRSVRLTAEWSRVGYSSLEPESNILIHVVRGRTARCGLFDPSGEPNVPPIPCRTDRGRLAKFRIDDADELRLGAEWTPGPRPRLVLRLGAWLDPDHQMRYAFDEADVEAGEPVAVENVLPPYDRLAARFRPGEDEIHVTAGLGWIASREHWQLDLGVDRSDRFESLSLSTVFRW